MKPLLILIGLLAIPNAWAGPSICDGNLNENYVAWPTQSPIWEMCYLNPGTSSATQGSSLEIRNVYLNGNLALERAHMPILFAQYISGLCYRDWKNDDAEFLQADQVENPTRAAITTCDVSTDENFPVQLCPFNKPDGSGAAGNPNDCITGVQVEKYDDRMVLTTNHAASWYKYTARFIFHADGRIQPRFGFGNSTGTQNDNTHWHHGYWRMNFDIDGPDNDQVFVIDSNGETLQTEEFGGFRVDNTETPFWLIKDSVTGRGYRIEPGSGGDSQLGGIDDYAVPPDPSRVGNHEIDVMATKYKLVNGMPEYSDTPGSNNLNNCTMREENLVGDSNDPGNLPESLDGENVVFWYRTAVNDLANMGMICKTGGPTMYPVGDWGFPDQPPVAMADNNTVPENSVDNVIDVLVNDSNADGGPAFVESVTQPANGVVVIGANGANVAYTPDMDYCNSGDPTDDFSYTLNGGSASVVSMRVTCSDIIFADGFE